MAQARFWIYHRQGWVRIKLSPYQSLSFTYGGPTDEGWSQHSETLIHDGAAVIADFVDDGVDCDGRLTHHTITRCPLESLAAYDCGCDDAPGLLPKWETISQRQRDEYAEAMNY